MSKSRMTPLDAIEWAMDYFFHMDESHAARNCETVRYSPLTIAIAEAYCELGGDSYAMHKVIPDSD